MVKQTKKDWSFIDNKALQKKIADTTKIMSVFYITDQQRGLDPLFVKELRRIYVLYAASIVEVLLVCLFKKGGFSIEDVVYKDPSPLPEKYQSGKDTIVLARQGKKQRPERRLTLDVLIGFFEELGRLPVNLVKRLRVMKDVRNTFHLGKSRQGRQLNSKSLEAAATAILEVAEIVRKELK
ncbi:MAG: hypothetical protein UY76_C0007G0006 [Candidatus Uhrbacteria bacterium GW2011_GWA2_52_8d]|uniref:RiboL-PSP-HEPN domain-containing protein n=1 Tax=Candidatus Uhrbacteria bacterium GW2011_GWA2_52_8d TaxID=1618979 RepID=A0A0G1XQR8_9BACT|nr:MAG: hypothetical protein UY76_C0007G0006 [Candidatus Uhrbacteria bacterium GW2011_GWA2_52_8d]